MATTSCTRTATHGPSPPSPTLTNPDMILPGSPSSCSSSPAPRPTLPSSLLRQMSPALYLEHQQRMGATPLYQSRPASSQQHSLSAKSSLGLLPSIHETSLVYQPAPSHEIFQASSPTLYDSRSGSVMDSWQALGEPQLGHMSGSTDSDDTENFKWSGADEPPMIPDRDDEDERDMISPLPKVMNSDNEATQDGDEVEEDDLEHTALSRRAEMILANAKKRLNLMEGNLRGARHSLLTSPATSNFSYRSASELNMARDREKRLNTALESVPRRAYLASPLSAQASPGRHSRVLSETSVPLSRSASNGYMREQRSTSALGSPSNVWSPPLYSRIRESRSHEVMRGNRDQRLIKGPDEPEQSRRKSSPPLKTSPTLGSVPENEPPHLSRPPSVTSDLRMQMDTLKGRISSLKRRADEDGMRRKSLQSLRTPSPFTSAEIWYTGADGYKADQSVDNIDGIQKPNGPGEQQQHHQPHEAAENDNHMMEAENDVKDDEVESGYPNAEEILNDTALEDSRSSEPEEFGEQPPRPNTAQDAESIYEDASYFLPTERHEDRADAFDYENFFLHSAMGTYSSHTRRSSTSSNTSVETTRPVQDTGIDVVETTRSTDRFSLGPHHRNPSVDSVSTVATFETCAERPGSDYGSDDEKNEGLDQVTREIMDRERLINSGKTEDVMAAGVADDSQESSTFSEDTTIIENRAVLPPPQGRGSKVPADARSPNHPAAKITSILLNAAGVQTGHLNLDKTDEELIHALAVSFQQACVDLQDTADDQYERRVWRRRLDAAKRILDGEDEDAF